MQTSTTRAETFSDGIMAIMITIMILELKLPDFDANQEVNDIRNHLKKLIQHFVAYIFSFVMIGILWTSHHHLFHLLEKTDNFLVRLNLFFLFWITLIPIVTGILGANPFLPISTALYGSVMLLTTASLSYMRGYTLKNDLIHSGKTAEINNKIFKVSVIGKRQSYISSFAYLLSIPLSFVSIYISYVCFAIPILLFFLPASIDEEKLENKINENS
ncbi:DUF1211 domain-containing protein [Chryseotalea sanaruensis]|uniref:DUF1211 domain-containing protein n=1 Tax=Chryseotalea sanaruensis TaxID=2482724 RepID=A0A401U6I4_9BACT|nr:TMEM175 family protein [Chryseotalea sanaruensis]GCC50487.1 DUF1211 domain-containing protein [Chryseotalea sanaruensis]